MSYLAIARKYRPGTFADIVGQDHVVRTLQNAIASQRIHHAYLFCGARGVGKTTAARALAKALNCDRGPTAEPCGVCTSCVEITAGSSPDLIEIDGASNNSVDDIRELRETVGYAPTRGRYKIYLIDEVHMLSKAAFNALLKTLEEPPPHVVFLFATTEANRILDTILSRVQRFDFKRIPVQAVADRLGSIAEAEGVPLSPAALRTIARAGEGSMRDAQSLLDKVISASSGGPAPNDAAVAETLGLVDRNLLLGFLEALVKGEADAAFEVIAQVYDFGYELSEFTGDLLEVVRNATFVSLSDRTRRHVDASADEIARLEQIVAGVPAEVLTRTFNALLDTHDQVSRATRPRVVLEMAVARLATTRPVEPVATLLIRLEELERKLRPAAGTRSARAPSARDARAPESAPKPVTAAPPKPSAPEAVAPKAVAPKAVAPKAAPPKTPPSSAGPSPGASAAPPSRRPARPAPPPADEEPPPLDDRDFAPSVDRGPEPPPAGTDDPRSFSARWADASAKRRARGMAEVEGLLRGAFPKIRTIDVTPAAGTGTPADHERALRAQVLDDPEVMRIVVKLGAELESVVSLAESRDDDPAR
ncbi:MAG: DNA polymerase III subunit gamma/tau [Myxococcota bacterium]